jgi:hypothetical protein
MTDAGGNYSQTVQDGLWYVAAGSTSYYIAADKSISVFGADVTGINFALQANTRNIPQTTNLLFSVVTDSLPAAGQTIANWPTYLPTVRNLPSVGSPKVATFGGVKWEQNNRITSNDGFRAMDYSANPSIPCQGVKDQDGVGPLLVQGAIGLVGDRDRAEFFTAFQR